MLSTFGAFEAAKSGLSVSMQQLNITEQNIANVNTEGYTRQRILTSAKEPSSAAYLIAQLSKANVGQGVETTGVQQIRNTYLDQQYRSLNTSYSYNSTRSDALGYLGGVLNELNEDSSLSKAIGNFFGAVNTFTKDTSIKEYRTNVQQQGLSLTESFRNVYEEMQSLWADQNDSIASVASKIGSVAQKIADLNVSIAKGVQTVGSANDLSDERNLLLDELSGYVDITYYHNTSNPNMIDVKIGGLTLIDGKNAHPITVDSAANHQARIDTLLSNVAAYNNSPASYTPADLTDMKTELAKYGSFTFTPNGLGGVDVALGGATLLSGKNVTATVEEAASSNLGAWVALNRNNLTLNGNTLDIDNGTITGGQLYSNIEMATSQSDATPGIPTYMKHLNTFVQTMAKNLNTINQSGWTYPDGSDPSRQGVNFFNVPSHIDNSSGTPVTVYDYDKVNAGNFALSSEVKQSANNIAGSSTEIILSGASPNTGDNNIALLLFKDLTDSGYYDKLNSIVSSLSIPANTSISITATKKSLLDSVETQRKSTSAVSLDEETTNLIIFQQSYNAAARVITTLDDMLSTIISRMGTTGT